MCETNSKEKGFHYQIETEALSKEENSKIEDYHEWWSEKNPDRTMRSLVKVEFENGAVYIVLHHEKRCIKVILTDLLRVQRWNG